jgi:hypothetical protein
MNPSPTRPRRSRCGWPAVMAMAVLCLQVVPVLAPAIAAEAVAAAFLRRSLERRPVGRALISTVRAGPAGSLRCAGPGPGLPRGCAWPACWPPATATAAGLVVAAVLIGLGTGWKGRWRRTCWPARAVPRRPLWFSIKQAGVQVGAVVASLEPAAWWLRSWAGKQRPWPLRPRPRWHWPAAAGRAAPAVPRTGSGRWQPARPGGAAAPAGAALAGLGGCGLRRSAGLPEQLLRHLRRDRARRHAGAAGAWLAAAQAGGWSAGCSGAGAATACRR